MRMLRLCAVGASVFLGLNSRLQADVVLNTNSTLNGGAPILSTPGVTNTAPSAPWLYTFTSSFNMGAFQLKTDNGEGIKLDLGGNSLTGNTGVTCLSTYYPQWRAGTLTIVNASGISIGRIDTEADLDAYAYGRYCHGGAVTIGEPSGTGSGPIAGHIRIECIDSHVRDGWNDGGNAGNITLYGSGDVRIETPVGVRGSVLAHNVVTGAGGSVNVRHRGAFVADQVLTYCGDSYGGNGSAGSVICDGNYGGAGAAGDFRVNYIDATYTKVNYGGANNPSIAISGYSNVLVGTNGIIANNNSTWGSTLAGRIAITNIAGNIQVDGPISAVASGGASGYGPLILIAGGKIMLANLDLSLVKSATLSAGADVYIEGSLLNFPTGSPANGLLDAPAGTTIHYRAKLTNNVYLGGASYSLKSGGRIRSEARGTVVMLK